MKISNLAKTKYRKGLPGRIGIIIDRAAQKNCYIVRFFDGKVPSSNSYRASDLRLINESW